MLFLASAWVSTRFQAGSALPRFRPPGLGLEASPLMGETLPLAQEAVHVAQLADHRAAERLFLLLGGLLFREVDHVLDRRLVAAQLLAERADLLDREARGEDGGGRLVLALLDALGERDLALAGEQGHLAHLAQVEADRILGAADRAGGQVDPARLRLLVVGLGVGGLGGHLRRQACGLGRVHQLDVHRAEHQHDVVELIERDEIGRQGVVHLVVGEKALLLALRDELVQLLDLRFVGRLRLVRHASPFSWWGVRVFLPGAGGPRVLGPPAPGAPGLAP